MTHQPARNRTRRGLTAAALTFALAVSSGLATAQAATAAPPAAVSAAAPAPTAASKVMVTTADLNLRKKPSTSAAIITTLAKGTKVTVIGSSGTWRKVTVGKRTGWVSSKFLKAVTVKKAATVTVTSKTKSNVKLGAKLTFAGKTSKNLIGKKVAVQILSGDSWSTVKSVKVTSKKTFSVTVKATQAGPQKYRVYAPSTKTTKAAKSKTYKYTVWSWYNIAGRSVDESGMWSDSEAVDIGGTHYPKSVLSYTGYSFATWADFNVGYKCTKFRATIGMSDTAKTGAERLFTLFVDSTEVNLGTRGIGKGLDVTADITDANRIRLQAFGNGNKVSGAAAYGDPQVYCSTSPY